MGSPLLPMMGFTCLKLLPRQPWHGWAGVILFIAVSRRPQPVHLKNRFVPCVAPGCRTAAEGSAASANALISGFTTNPGTGQ